MRKFVAFDDALELARRLAVRLAECAVHSAAL